MDQPNDNTPLPPKLSEALRGMYTPPAGFRGNDARILAAARAAGVRHAGRWKWAVGMGLAAAVAIAATLFATRTPDSGQALHETAYARTGDIRDAFYVARQLKAHRALEAKWDLNGDGVVDDKDWHVLAASAVSLSPRGTVQ